MSTEDVETGKTDSKEKNADDEEKDEQEKEEDYEKAMNPYGAKLCISEFIVKKSIRTYDIHVFILFIYGLLALIVHINKMLNDEDTKCTPIFLLALIIMLIVLLFALLVRCAIPFIKTRLFGIIIGIGILVSGLLYFGGYFCECSRLGVCGGSCLGFCYYLEPILVLGLCILFAELNITGILMRETDKRIKFYAIIIFIYCILLVLCLYSRINDLSDGEKTLLSGAMLLSILLLIYFFVPMVFDKKLGRIAVGIGCVLCGVLMFSGYLTFLSNAGVDELAPVTIAVLSLFSACLLGQDMILIQVIKDKI